MAAKAPNADVEGVGKLCDRLDATLQSRLELIQLGLSTLLHLCRTRDRENAQLEAQVRSLLYDLKEVTTERDSLNQKVKGMEAMVQLQKTELERCEGFNSDAMVKRRCADGNTMPSNDAAEGATLRTGLVSEAEGEAYMDTTEQLHEATSPTSVYDNSPLSSLSSLSSGGEDLDDSIPSYGATRSESEHQQRGERKRDMDSLHGGKQDVGTVPEQSRGYLHRDKRQKIDGIDENFVPTNLFPH